jgi:hypothetical protein
MFRNVGGTIAAVKGVCVCVGGGGGGSVYLRLKSVRSATGSVAH